MGGDVQGGLIRTDRADLVDDDAAGQLLPELKRGHRAAALELVHAVADAMHLGPELPLELEAVARVVAVGEHGVLGRPVGEPFEPLCRQQGVKCDPLLGEVIGADLLADMRVNGGPVPEAGSNFSHAR